MARFTIPLDKVAAKVRGELEESVRGATHQLFRKVVDRTPIESGRARANWNVSTGRANRAVTESTDQTRGYEQADKVLSIPAGSTVFLTNALPYIRALEYGLYPNPPKKPTGRTVNGFSSQAPQGMVRISVAEFDAMLKGKS